MRAHRVGNWRPVWAAGAVVIGGLAAGALVVEDATVTLLLTATLCTLSVLGVVATRLPNWFLKALWALLLVYAILGKGGAYLNVGGIFVGELVLAFGIIAVLFGGAAAALPYESRLAWGVVAFGLWGAVRTIPYIGTYGSDALRDAVVWAYGAFALLVAGTLLRTGRTHRVVETYGRWMLWYPVWVPVAWALSRVTWSGMPTAPGTDVPLVFFKAGDPTLHLVAVATFVLLGFRRPTERDRRWFTPGGWVWWSTWFAACGIVAAISRAGMLAILCGAGVVVALRPALRVGRPILVAFALGVAFLVSDIRVEVRDGRYLSAQDIAANVVSIAGEQAKGDRNLTRAWRLDWWRTIIGYTVRGPYFWTGKGYGVNLAKDDGFVVGETARHPLRSPHNAHLTILARGGVPGAAIWVMLQCGFAFALVLAYRRAVHTRRDWWARVDLWILGCWLAYVVNAAFDVSLEGPQGGIWFWSILGFGIAALEVQRRDRGARTGAAPAAALWPIAVGSGATAK
jgi:hypothetical protein